MESMQPEVLQRLKSIENLIRIVGRPSGTFGGERELFINKLHDAFDIRFPNGSVVRAPVSGYAFS